MVKSVQLLYNGDNEVCKQNFKAYLTEQVLKGNRESDSALRKYFKLVIQRFAEEYATTFAQSNLIEVKDML